MSDPDEWVFPDFGMLPSPTGAEVLSVDPVPGGVRVVLFVPIPAS